MPTADLSAALRTAAADPARLSDAHAAALLGADGPALEELCAIADAVRAQRAGHDVTYVVNRNLDTERVGAGTPAARARVRELAAEAQRLGATEVCAQGPLPPGAPADGYLDLVRDVAAGAPGIHLHAFRPAEVADAAERRGSSPREFLLAAREAGLGSVPGTAARILDDGVRARLAGRPDLPVARWVELITTAHEVGLTSTATMVHGHVETPAQQVAHLRLLASIAERTGGFTEFIPMPFVPPPGAALPAGCRPGPDAREVRAVTAVARLLLAGRIEHVQAPWPKLGEDLVVQLLAGGADDLGGLLLDGELDPAAGQEQGLTLTRADVQRLAASLGRGVRRRTTRYGDPAGPPEPAAVPA
ncbi:FO synthase [Kineococcus auxinigenes]|uniref:FO synthase n=1 Tax=unclassified Kineococcus TaxID=2621656 RepID=UPI003D7EBF1B